jgi:hypothetical protein
MTQQIAPRIYIGSSRSPAMARSTRLLAALTAIACLAVLVTAAWLRPDPSGLGTHRQLGLASCGLLATVGIPCPTCGMTTSFANLAHGHVVDSLRGQPAGTVLGALTAVAFWVATYVAITGRPGAAIVRRLPVTGALLTLLGIILAGWAYTIAVVLRHGG